MGNLIPRGDTRRNEHASRMDRGWAGVKNRGAARRPAADTVTFGSSRWRIANSC